MPKQEITQQKMSQTDLFFGSRGGCGIITQPLNFVHYIYIDEPLENPSDWRKELHVIRTAAPGDVIHLHLNTPGGNITVLGAFLKAIKESEALTVAHVEQECHSAGGPLMLACDQVVLADEAELMIHTAFAGCGGKHNNMVSQVEHSKKFIEKQFHKWYKDFITEEEIERVLTGSDMWMDAEEIFSRLQKRAEIQRRPNEDLTYEVAKNLSKEDILANLWPTEYSQQKPHEVVPESPKEQEGFTGERGFSFFVKGECWFTDEDIYSNRATSSFELERDDCIEFFEATGLMYSRRESTPAMNKRIYRYVKKCFGMDYSNEEE